jgi:hypothetical protein
MPEMNIPAIKMKAAGARSIPPEIARPLVQPPARLAPYCRMTAPKKPITKRFRREAPKTFFQVGSVSQRILNVPLLMAPSIPPKKIPMRSISPQSIPGGMTALK